MYDYGRKVYCKSLDRVGEIVERNRLNGRAAYVVKFGPGDDFLTGSDDLRGADYQCDTCGQWRTGTPAAVDRVLLGDGTVDDQFVFCFLCSRSTTTRSV